MSRPPIGTATTPHRRPAQARAAAAIVDVTTTSGDSPKSKALCDSGACPCEPIIGFALASTQGVQAARGAYRCS
jgi:hypothetical protein